MLLGGVGTPKSQLSRQNHIPKRLRDILGSGQAPRPASFTSHCGSVTRLPPKPAGPLTRVGDAVLLTLLPSLVDDAHPHQRGQDDAAHHSNGEDAYGGPVLPAAGGR